MKKIISVVVILLIASAVVIYLIALDNRYKQIAGKDYFDIWTGKTVKAESTGSAQVVVEYPLLKSKYQLETDPDINPSK